MRSPTNSTMCPRLGIDAAVAETAETRFSQGILWIWWRCQACGGWHLSLGHQHRPSGAKVYQEKLTPVPA
jgi:hypothetical protein